MADQSAEIGQVRGTLACEVGLNEIGCEFPPGLSLPAIRSRCYACGQRACRVCSTLRRWPEGTGRGKRRVRVCNDCAGDYQNVSTRPEQESTDG